MDQAEPCSKQKSKASPDAENSVWGDRKRLAEKKLEKNWHCCHPIQYRGGETS